jgi:hypothetical protein
MEIATGDDEERVSQGPAWTLATGWYKRSVELSDLRGDERLALVALLKVAVVADGRVSRASTENSSTRCRGVSRARTT